MTCQYGGVLTGMCVSHGNLWPCATERVLGDVSGERASQYRQYGTNESLKDGTGEFTHWLRPLSEENAWGIQEDLRNDYEAHEREYGAPTWMHLVREEVAEAFQEDDPVHLRAELIQVAALCVSWVEKLDQR